MVVSVFLKAKLAIFTEYSNKNSENFVKDFTEDNGEQGASGVLRPPFADNQEECGETLSDGDGDKQELE